MFVNNFFLFVTVNFSLYVIKRDTIDAIIKIEDDINCGGGSAALTIEETMTKEKETIFIAKSSIIPYQPVIKSKEDIDVLIKAIETKLERELEEKGQFKLV